MPASQPSKRNAIFKAVAAAILPFAGNALSAQETPKPDVIPSKTANDNAQKQEVQSIIRAIDSGLDEITGARRKKATPAEINEHITTLGDRSYAKREKATRWLMDATWQAEKELKTALKQALADSDLEIRSRANHILWTLQSFQKVKIEILLGNVWSLHDKDAEDAVPALIKVFTEFPDHWLTTYPELDVKYHVTRVLTELGPKAKAAVPVLLKALKSKNRDSRLEAAEALTSIRLIPKSALPLLIDALNDTHSWVRCQVAIILGNMGPDAKETVPDLINRLHDHDDFVRKYATIALGDIGGEAKVLVPALIAALKDKVIDVKKTAAEVLGKMGAEAKAAVPELIGTLKRSIEGTNEVFTYPKGTEGKLISNVIAALAKIGDASAVSALKEFRDSKPNKYEMYQLGKHLSEVLRQEAAEAIKTLEGELSPQR